MDAGDHAIELFCIDYGCVLGLYFDTLHFEVYLCALLNVYYICGCDVAQFVIVIQFSLCGVSRVRSDEP